MNSPSADSLAPAPDTRPDPDFEAKTAARAQQLCLEEEGHLFERTDRLFSYLLLGEWLVGIVLAFAVSPHTWIGARHQVHLHVWLAAILGGFLSIVPVSLCFSNPRWPLNRYALTAGQMMTCALWVHLTGGRIETHFFYF